MKQIHLLYNPFFVDIFFTNQKPSYAWPESNPLAESRRPRLSIHQNPNQQSQKTHK